MPIWKELAIMIHSELGPDEIQRTFDDRVAGHAPWNVRLGHGTYVFLDFGNVINDGESARQRGSVQLWIVEAIWRIEDSGRLICGSDDEGTAMANGLAYLRHQTVTSAFLTGPLLDLQLTFENGMTFRTFRCSAEEDAWRLFVDASTVFHAPDGTFARESANQPE